MLNSNISCVGETTELERRIATAQAAARDAQANLESAQTRQTQAKATIRAISHSYHPYDPATGAVRDAKTVAAELETNFATLETVVAEANLSTRCQEQIRKAKRVMVKMLATISFFFLTIQAKVEALSLTAEQEQAVYEQLIPGIYTAQGYKLSFFQPQKSST